MKLITLIFFLFTFSLPVLAAPDCKEELKSLCAEEGISFKSLKCLWSNKARLSKDCSENVEKLARTKGECAFDTIVYCSNDKVPENHLDNPKCLADNKFKLSRACRELSDKAQLKYNIKKNETINIIAEACESEYATCGNPADKKARQCVADKYKANKVSEKCKTVIDETLKK